MDEVLDFTQIESDAVTVITAEVNLNELVRSTCAGGDVAEARLLLSKAPAPDVLVLCDPGKVRQVLSNYLANAIKYGDPPGAEVDLLAEHSCPEKMRITIQVTSRGPTLKTDELNVLFTALTRGQRARETGAHGTGLGLALCKKLAHAMGGSVGVESADGKTTFWFKADFPVVSVIAPQPLPAPALYLGCNVLAVEDEFYNRLVLEHHLQRFGVTSTWAENGAAALAAAKNQRFDVILMDWLLPDMDGPELLVKLKELQGGSLPPVIVLSAYSTANKRLECLAAGAAAFVSKPIDLTRLSAAFEFCKLGTSKSAALSPS
jgi:CheY-like chemotaxis protein